MAGFQERIQVIIDSAFDSEGFDKLESQLSKATREFNKLDSMFKRARGIADMQADTEELQEKLEALGLEFESVDRKRAQALQQLPRTGGLGLKQAAQEGGFFRQDGEVLGGGRATEILSNFESQSKSVQQQMRNFPDAPLGGVSGLVDNADQMNQTLHQQRGRIDNVVGSFDNYQDRVKEGNKANKEGAEQAREFRFEFLGLMFAGMALQNAMFGLLRPAFEAAGIFELISSILEFMFLPTALDVLDVITNNMDAIFNMDEEMRRTIGTIVMVVGALGTLLFVGGQVALALDSIGIFLSNFSGMAALASSAAGKLSFVMGGLSNVLGLLTGSGAGSGLVASLASTLGSITAPMLALGAIVAGVAAIILTNYKGITDSIINFIKSLEPFINMFKGLFEFMAKSILTQTGMMLEAIGHFFNFLFSIWETLGEPVLVSLGSNFIIAANLARKAFQIVKEAGKDAVNWLSNTLGPALDKTLEAFSIFSNEAKKALSILPGVSFEGGKDTADVDIDTAGATTDKFLKTADMLGLGKTTKKQLRSFNNLVDATGRVGRGINREIISAGRSMQNVNFNQNIEVNSNGSGGETPLSQSRNVSEGAERGARNGISRLQSVGQ